MKITNIKYSLKNNKARLSAQMILESGKIHDVFFEVDKKFKDFIAKDASTFIAASLGISMVKNENLYIHDSVSEHLMKNTNEIMKQIISWGHEFNSIEVLANFLKKDLNRPKGVGSFFSGGVDSFYTFYRNKKKIKYLIFVHGFDIDVNDLKFYKSIERNIMKIAKKEKVKLIKVKTNIRETFEQYFDWNLSHEFAIGSVALFLRHGFKEIFASCGLPNKNTDHHYMTPELDSLWSTENMKLNHYGCDADKTSKLRFLSNYKLVMENLRVCWVNKKKQYNCCECEKCFRNMLSLYVSDSLEKCKTFKKGLDLYKLKNTRIMKYNLKYFVSILKDLKLKGDKSEVRFALEECIKNNQSPSFGQRTYRSIRDFIRFLDKKYNSNRLYWFLAHRGLI